MSIPFRIFVRFLEPKDPVERFIEIASRFEATQNYGPVRRLEVQDALYVRPEYTTRKKKHKDFFDEHIVFQSHAGLDEEGLSTTQIPKLLEPFRGEHYRVAGRWTVLNRYYWDDDEDPEDRVSIELATAGRSSTWTIATYRRADIYYEAGDNHSIRTRKQAQGMAQETVSFIELGAETMWGYTGNETSDPRTTFLRYYRDPDAYREDLRHPPDAEFGEDVAGLFLSERQMMRPITNDDVIAAALYSDDEAIEVLETPGGPVVYSTDICGLGSFYSALYKNMSSYVYHEHAGIVTNL